MMRFLEMGGYYPWVWPSFAVTLAVMGLNIYWARRLLARAQRTALRRLQMQEES